MYITLVNGIEYGCDRREKQIVRAQVVNVKKRVMHMWAYDRANQDAHLRPGLTLKIKNALRKKDGQS